VAPGSGGGVGKFDSGNAGVSRDSAAGVGKLPIVVDAANGNLARTLIGPPF